VAQRKGHRRILVAVVFLGIAALVVLALLPSRQLVEAGRAEKGSLRVTIDEEGETRARERFTISAPVPGRLMRVEFDDGDPVSRGQVVARLDPLPLSQRERQEVLARVDAAEAALREANARQAHAGVDHDLAHRDRERAEGLARDGVISAQAVDQARNADLTSEQELNAAKFAVEAAASEVRVARAGLVGLDVPPGKPRPLVDLRSPVTGYILRVLEKSEHVVSSGTPILVLAQPKELEVVTDVLSTDAVRIQPGAPVLLEGWGGDRPLRARVRLVEPGGFTKISALGVEEQRVNVICDFVDPPGRLGDGYRVDARIVIWSGENVLKAPTSAVFRHGTGWSAFVIEGGRAKRREVEIGHRSETEVEILRGLSPGEEVILHPSNELREGGRVRTL
jgi:HlyD family secretion protein